MALTKFNYNSFDLTTVASTGLAFNSSANGFDTASAGALNLISTNTISSGVSSSSFTSGIGSTYDTYLFKIINCHPASTAKFTVNFSIDSGSNYNVTKTATHIGVYHRENGAASGLQYEDGRDTIAATSYVNISDDNNTDNDHAVNGEMYLFNPSSTTFVKHFIARTRVEALYTTDGLVGGFLDTTSAIDAVDFKFASGNIDSGVIKMYGLSKS